jgi:heme exporter protein D
MMPDLGKYTVEVLSAYGVTIVLLVALLLLTLRRGRNARAALRLLEEETARNAKN